MLGCGSPPPPFPAGPHTTLTPPPSLKLGGKWEGVGVSPVATLPVSFDIFSSRFPQFGQHPKIIETAGRLAIMAK